MLVQRKIRDVDYSFLRMIQSNNLFFHCGGELVVTTALALKQLGDIQNAGLTAVSFLFLIAL